MSIENLGQEGEKHEHSTSDRYFKGTSADFANTRGYFMGFFMQEGLLARDDLE